MRKLLFLLVLSFFGNIVFSQTKISVLEQAQYRISRNGMLVLGSWGIANTTLGLIGRQQTTGNARYFHEMNIGWGLVNTTLATIGYFAHPKDENPTFDRIDAFQKKTERIFLINAGLDLVYMGSGALLKQKGTTTFPQNRRMIGYGNSLILQGGFLFLFDGFMYAIHRNHRKQISLLKNAHFHVTGSGFSFVYKLG